MNLWLPRTLQLALRRVPHPLAVARGVARPALAALFVVAPGGCGRADSPSSLTLHVRGHPGRTSSTACAFLIHAAVVEGGSQTTCLQSVAGFPARGALTRAQGTMSFSLRQGSLRMTIAVRQRFARDGVHARQILRGTVVGGTGVFANARGSITGGGSVADSTAGLIFVRLEYHIRLTR